MGCWFQAMPTLDVMRATFGAAAALLSNAQLELFEHATGTSAVHLVDEVLALPAVTLSRVLDLGHGELGNNVPHPLNAKGLHVLRWLLARVIVDERREQNGWRTHALYDRFKRDGILMRKLQHWEGSDRGVPLTTEESELIALATGRATNPYLCADKDGATRDYPTNRTSGLIVRGSYAHTFRDDDAQYQLHVDVYLPNIKFMVFTETVVATNGPFHFVRGSHKASAAKARWLFERTLNKTDPSRGAGAAFRHVNEKGGWCTASSACLREAYNWQQHDLARSFGFPLPTATVVEAGTLVVVDTSGFHFRGIGVAGRLRARMGKVRGRKSNPPSFGCAHRKIDPPPRRGRLLSCAEANQPVWGTSPTLGACLCSLAPMVARLAQLAAFSIARHKERSGRICHRSFKPVQRRLEREGLQARAPQHQARSAASPGGGCFQSAWSGLSNAQARVFQLVPGRNCVSASVATCKKSSCQYGRAEHGRLM